MVVEAYLRYLLPTTDPGRMLGHHGSLLTHPCPMAPPLLLDSTLPVLLVPLPTRFNRHYHRTLEVVWATLLMPPPPTSPLFSRHPPCTPPTTSIIINSTSSTPITIHKRATWTPGWIAPSSLLGLHPCPHTLCISPSSSSSSSSGCFTHTLPHPPPLNPTLAYNPRTKGPLLLSRNSSSRNSG